MSLLHSQSGLALVLSLLLLMVINYYYPATRSAADVMSPMSLGQREKKKKSRVSEPGRAPGSRRCEVREVLPLSPVRQCFGRSLGRRLLPAELSAPQLSVLLACLDAGCPTGGSCPRFGSRGYLGRKHKIRTGSSGCLPLSSNFG